MKRHLLTLLGFLLTFGCSAQITVDEADVFPESLAYSDVLGGYLLSSLGKNKIVLVKDNGNTEDFISSGEFGFKTGVGLKISPDGKYLWALSSDSKEKKSALYKFDVAKKTISKVFPSPQGHDVFFNDLCFDTTGNIYITDSDHKDVYVLQNGADDIIRFVSSEFISYPNGITYDPKSNELIVASAVNGLVRINCQSKSAMIIKCDTPVVKGLDGLYLYKDRLIGVCNGTKNISLHGAYSFWLNPTGDLIEQVETLSVTGMVAPTTGVLVNNKFHFLGKTFLHEYLKGNVNSGTRAVIYTVQLKDK